MMGIYPSSQPPLPATFPYRLTIKHIPQWGGPVCCNLGLMRFIFLTTSGMINAERFTILPTHRINFKRGPD